jgi:hypothetical protein
MQKAAMSTYPKFFAMIVTSTTVMFAVMVLGSRGRLIANSGVAHT